MNKYLIMEIDRIYRMSCKILFISNNELTVINMFIYGIYGYNRLIEKVVRCEIIVSCLILLTGRSNLMIRFSITYTGSFISYWFM